MRRTSYTMWFFLFVLFVFVFWQDNQPQKKLAAGCMVCRQAWIGEGHCSEALRCGPETVQRVHQSTNWERRLGEGRAAADTVPRDAWRVIKVVALIVDVWWLCWKNCSVLQLVSLFCLGSSHDWAWMWNGDWCITNLDSSVADMHDSVLFTCYLTIHVCDQ